MTSSRPVLHALAWPGEISGAVRSMEESLAALRSEGVDARAWLAVANRFGQSGGVDRLRSRDIPLELHHADLWLAPRAVTSLARSLKALGPGRVLHTHGERALLWGRAAARLARCPHVHTNHGFVAGDARGERRVRVARKLSSGLAALIAVHGSAAEGLPSAQVLPNCLDAEAFRSEGLPRDAVRRRLGLAEGAPCCLFLGRLSPEKGADLLALVQARLQAASGSACLHVAGAGTLASGVEAMEDVRLLGPRDDAASLLAAADVLLMPSRSEGLPMVALEAAAMSLPVVAFPAGGLADSGLASLVPMENVDALVDRALELVRSPSAREQQLEAAAAALGARFSPAPHAERLIDLYAAL